MNKAQALPPLSVVVTAREQCDALRRHLPAMLEQEYPADYEVIVVDMGSTDDTLPYLEQMTDRYPHLHVTQAPGTARNVSPIRLALTLGFRAASHDWVVLTQANCQPASPHWLLRMGEACAEDEARQIVLGYTRFTDGRGWHGLRCRFFRTWQQTLYLPYASRHGAYRSEGTNLCYRSSLFMAHRGFADHANLLTGATDIMVNRHSTRHNTGVCLHPESFVLQDTPRYRRWWSEERLFFMETRRHFRRRHLYRLTYALHALLAWLLTLCAVAAILLALLWIDNYVVAIVAGSVWTIINICRAVVFNKHIKSLSEPSFTWSLPLLFHLIVWWDTAAWLRWCFTPKRVFQKKFI